MKSKLFSEVLMHLIILLISNLLLLNKQLYIYIDKISPILNPIIYLYIALILVAYLVLDIFYNVDFKKLLIVYICFLLITLFLRPFHDDFIYNKIFYLESWIKRLFQNKIIFLNIIGNIILYIPLGYILKKRYLSNLKIMLLSLLMIVFFEFIQFALKVGVFDFIDIFLNILGVFIGMLVKGTKCNE